MENAIDLTALRRIKVRARSGCVHSDYFQSLDGVFFVFVCLAINSLNYISILTKFLQFVIVVVSAKKIPTTLPMSA